jgi:UPF0716 family protein affecting phage T7 exclusion
MTFGVIGVGFDQTIGFMIALCSCIGTEMERIQTMQQIIEMLAEMKASRKADQVNAKVNKEDMLAKFRAKMDG